MQAHPEIPDRPCAACPDRLVDRLTGLVDRSSWDTQASAVLCDAQQRNEPITVLIVDLDHFKSINDRMGHPTGDAVLAGVADVLRRTVGCAGLVGRYGGHGGDEFLIMLRQADVDHAEQIAERLRHGIRDLALTVTTNSGARVRLRGVTASVGLTSCAATADVEIGQLIRTADSALQQAKRCGRDRIHLADPAAPCATTTDLSEPAHRPREQIGPQALDHRTHLRHLLHLSDVMNGQWHPDVLLALSTGPHYWNDLLNTIRNGAGTAPKRKIHGSMLSRTLRRLEASGLVDRIRERNAPRSTQYALTPAGERLITALEPVVRWSHRHEDRINGRTTGMTNAASPPA